MGLAERLDELTAPKTTHCKYVRLLDRLREQDDPDAVDRFATYVAEKRIKGPAAAQALHAELDEKISPDTIQKHHRGGCGCST